MTVKPSSANEALESELESKVDLGTTQTSADYNMRKRQITQDDDKDDGEVHTTIWQWPQFEANIVVINLNL